MRGGKSVERLCPIFLLQLLVDGDRLGGGGFLSGAKSSKWVQGEDCASISRFHTSTIPRWYKVAHSDSFPFPLLHEPSQYNSQVFSGMKKSAIIRVAISFYRSDKRIKLHNLPNHLPLYLLVASVDPSPLASPSSCGSPVARRRWAPLEARLQQVSPPGQLSIQCYMGGLALGKGSKYLIKTL